MPSRALAIASLVPLLATSTVAQDSHPSPEIRYRSVPISGFSAVVALQKAHGPAGFDAILRVNRLDLPHVRQDSALVVPEAPASLAALTPFPLTLTWPDDSPAPARFLVVARRIQAFAAYESGTLVCWGPVSTGRRDTPTPPGLFATNWKAKLRQSSDNDEGLLPWYVNFINATGISFHQFALPGYPASHACVRLLEANAKWIHDWAETWVLDDEQHRVLVQGTPVLVYGEYDYDKPGPWTRLADDPRSTTVTREGIQRAVVPHRPVLAEWIRLRQQWEAGRTSG